MCHDRRTVTGERIGSRANEKSANGYYSPGKLKISPAIFLFLSTVADTNLFCLSPLFSCFFFFFISPPILFFFSLFLSPLCWKDFTKFDKQAVLICFNPHLETRLCVFHIFRSVGGNVVTCGPRVVLYNILII